MATSSMSSSSSASEKDSSSPPTISSNLNLLISNLCSFVTIKLDSTNFIVWKNQFQNILRATGLLCYVDGTKPCPTANQGDSETVSKDRDQWLLTDAHLYSCITEYFQLFFNARPVMNSGVLWKGDLCIFLTHTFIS